MLQSTARRPSTWASYIRLLHNGWMSVSLCTHGYGVVVVVVADFRQKGNYLGITRCMSGFLCTLGYGAVTVVVVVVADFRQQSNYLGIIHCMSGILCTPGYGVVVVLQTSARRATTWASHAACLVFSVLWAMALLLLLQSTVRRATTWASYGPWTSGTNRGPRAAFGLWTPTTTASARTCCSWSCG